MALLVQFYFNNRITAGLRFYSRPKYRFLLSMGYGYNVIQIVIKIVKFHDLI